MSYNQSTSDRSDIQYRRTRRSTGYHQQQQQPHRSSPAGYGRGAGTGAVTDSSTNVDPSSSSKRSGSLEKPNNAQGWHQPRVNHSVPDNHNGLNVQSRSQGMIFDHGKMSYNQSTSDRSDIQYRRTRRSTGYHQQQQQPHRSSPAGYGRGAGTGAVTDSSTNVDPSSSSKRSGSLEKPNNAQGWHQPRVNHSVPDNHNGPNVQSRSQVLDPPLVRLRAKNQLLRNSCMNSLLSLIETLCQPLEDLSNEDLIGAEIALTYVKDSGFSVDWLEKKLDQVKEMKEKEVSGLAILQVTEDKLLKLKQKCAELEALAEEQKAESSATITPLSFYDVV
ncbi:hypothetical protein F2Q68_00045068 [Brassica cretica]|uniref:Uncharacterized protein n=1 Tax=Brassica cretica TaxID=69181 RepID=A0A8S9LR61_BRACR|nr:hypothetical protein F2Q68_00045068 [Brassica cretica]